MQEHARWSVLMTIISLLLLKESDLKRPFARAMKAVFDQSKLRASTACSADATIATKVDGKSLIDILTITLAAIVKTNSALSTPEMTIENRDDKAMLESIRLSRRLFQLMCEAAAQSTDQSTRAARRRGRGTAANSRAPSRAASVAPAVAGGISTPAAAAALANTMATVEIEEDDAVDDDVNVGQHTVAQKAHKYRQWSARPNVHIGLHYIDVYRRYGLVSLLMVLPGEMKHK